MPSLLRASVLVPEKTRRTGLARNGAVPRLRRQQEVVVVRPEGEALDQLEGWARQWHDIVALPRVADARCLEAIGRWLSYYNIERPHSTHGLLTPDKAYDSKQNQ